MKHANEHLDGKSTADKEQEVRELIRRTSSRVMPGIRYLPQDYYPDDEVTEVRVRRSRRKDRDGQLVIDTDDEQIVISNEGKPTNSGRDKNHVQLPSASAKLPDPYTDSETSSSTSSSSSQHEFKMPAGPTRAGKVSLCELLLCQEIIDYHVILNLCRSRKGMSKTWRSLQARRRRRGLARTSPRSPLRGKLSTRMIRNCPNCRILTRLMKMSLTKQPPGTFSSS